jgi:N-acetylmuramoyl-L-alanine amidase
MDWVRVEVMQEIDGNPWLIGWLEAHKVEAGDFEPEVRDNLLFTTDGRQYKFIPALHTNFDAKTDLTKEDILFIVMHITTGIYLQSTVNYFSKKNPERVSTHLVIGRDGRVVQMVPFNRAAHHAGPGSWEGTERINWHSIGIELDNAGKLVEKSDGTVMSRTSIIPSSQWECIRQWKLNREKPWQTFPDVQIKVAFRVVKALAKHFQPLEELLEHERISLKNRDDPGPLFPMETLRKEVLGREQPVFKLHRTHKEETILYENSCYQPPDLNYPKFANPLPECQVTVLDNSCDYWVKIEVKKCKKQALVGRRGWVRKADVKLLEGKHQMIRSQDMYKDLGTKRAAPSLPLGKPLLVDTKVRVVRKDDSGWTLVAIPEHKIGFRFLDGWVRSEDLEEVVG